MTASKVALVTGASSGIGRSTAEMLVRRGYRVFGTSRVVPSVHRPSAVDHDRLARDEVDPRYRDALDGLPTF